MVRKFPQFRFEWKKRSTSEGTPQFPNRISGKLPYHLTSNRNLRLILRTKNIKNKVSYDFYRVFLGDNEAEPGRSSNHHISFAKTWHECWVW